MKKSEATATSVHKPVSTVIVLLCNLRLVRLAMCPPTFSASHAPDQLACQHVYDEGDEEQNQTEFNERLQIDLGCCFGELVGNNRGDRVGGIKHGSGYLRPVADHHRHCHRFANCAAKPKYYRSGYSRLCVLQNNKRCFPFR